MVARAKVEHTLQWLRVLCGQASSGLRATVLLNPSAWRFGNTIVLDASPWGGGGFLSVDGVPSAYFYTEWGPEDVASLGITIGDHRCQALVETFVVLVAVRAWASKWAAQPTSVYGRSDAMAAIGAVERGGSTRSTAVNKVLKELALETALSRTGLRIRLRHIKGDRNQWADALSRIHQPGSGARVPAPLLACELTPLAPRDETWWKTAGVPEEVLDGVGTEEVV